MSSGSEPRQHDRTPGGSRSTPALSVGIIGPARGLASELATDGRVQSVSIERTVTGKTLGKYLDARAPDVLVLEAQSIPALCSALESAGAPVGMPPVICVCDARHDDPPEGCDWLVDEYVSCLPGATLVGVLGAIAHRRRSGAEARLFRCLVAGSIPDEVCSLARALAESDPMLLPVAVPTVAAARRWLERRRFDAVLLFETLADGRGADCIPGLTGHNEHAAVIGVLEHDCPYSAVEWVRRGCHEVLTSRDRASRAALASIVCRRIAESQARARRATFESASHLDVFVNEQAELIKAARSDTITGLPNRAVFDDLIADLCVRSERGECAFSLGVADIDGFKLVNDREGHPAGDALLRGLAHTMQQALGPAGLICRIGGDEFAYVIENLDTDEAVRISEDICAAVHQAHSASAVSVSIGITHIPAGFPCGPDAVLRAADTALYSSKHRGRNRVTYNSFAASALT
jgi:diguanylate cyclase (GGDEF)-like protein